MKVFKVLKVALKYKFILISYIAIFTFMTLIFSQTGNEDISLSRLNIGIKWSFKFTIFYDFIKYLSMKNNVKLDKFDENTAKKDLFISKYGVAIIINPDFEKNILAKKKKKLLLFYQVLKIILEFWLKMKQISSWFMQML